MTPSPLRLRRNKAERAAARGNYVRAALLRAKGSGLLAGQAELRPLLEDLGRVLALDPAEQRRYAEEIPALLDPATTARLSIETRALFDLQALCADARRPDPLDFVEWIRTFGRRPYERDLPVLRDVLRVRRLGRVRQRLHSARARVRVARSLAEVIEPRLEALRNQLREALHPRLAAALDEAGLRPRNHAEQVARRKVVDQLLDRLLRRGALDFGDLRDTLARNQAKMADLRSPWEWLVGDALLRADQRFAEVLDGVYHRGEWYLRQLQRLQGPLFGTRWGRTTSKFLLAPLGGAYLALETVGYLLEHLVGPFQLVTPQALLMLAVVIATLLNWRQPREWLWTALRRILGGLHRDTSEDAASESPSGVPPLPAARTGGFGGFLQGIVNVYRDARDWLDSVVYLVDEWLRFRGGNWRGARLVEAVVALGWYLIGYVFRFAFRLVVEPTFNPIKHFPIVTISGKISIALGLPIFVSIGLAEALPVGLAWSLGWFLMVLVLPGFCGFLAWEIGFNWRLYDANRSLFLQAAVVGGHGETMTRLLRPGFYSGTIPKHLKRLGRAIREAGPDSPRARAASRRVDDIARGIGRFVDRDLLALLAESRTFRGVRFRRGTVNLTPLRVTFSLFAAGRHLGQDDEPCQIVFLIAERRLCASLARPGFAQAFAPSERRVFESVLLAFMALSGAHRVRGLGGLRIPWSRWVEFWEEELRGSVSPLLPGLRLLP